MLYIEKEGLPNDVNRKIIELSKSEEWKNIREDDTTAIREAFDNDFPKNEVKEILLHEQHGICAYCMRRIRMDNHSRVEHLVPLSRNKEMAIDYYNMLGVCDGGEKITGNHGHILCCDAHKKETEITISPLNKAQMDKIAYDSDGKIYTKPKDEDMERDINEVLLLNGIQKKDGTVRDTSTELLKCRKDAYGRAKRMMETLNSKGKCTSATLKKIMDELYNREERDEFVGVQLYYFRKHYNSLIRRGMLCDLRIILQIIEHFIEHYMKLGAAAKNKNDTLSPTIAELLFFGEAYHIIEIFPNYFLNYCEECDDKTVRWLFRTHPDEGDWSGNIYDFFCMVHTFDFSECNDRVTLKLEVGQVVYIPDAADIRSTMESREDNTTKAISKEDRILAYVRENGSISTQKVMEICNYNSRTGARNILDKMVNADLIEKVGKKMHYKIKE